MSVGLCTADGKGNLQEIMYSFFPDRIADVHRPYQSGHTINIYDINDVAVIHATRDGDNLGRNLLRMIGAKERFSQAKSEIERRTGFKLEIEVL